MTRPLAIAAGRAVVARATRRKQRIEPRIGAAAIAGRVDSLAREIATALPKNVLIVSILKGSFVFVADLIRALSKNGRDWPMDFMSLSSYGAGTSSSGKVKVVRDIAESVTGRTILLIDDILESGRTLKFARALLRKRGAKRVYICALLDKPSRRAIALEADFKGFVIADEFVVGYGLDWAHQYRGLPFIGVVRRS